MPFPKDVVTGYQTEQKMKQISAEAVEPRTAFDPDNPAHDLVIGASHAILPESQRDTAVELTIANIFERLFGG